MACPNLSEYIKAGFTPVCGCRLDTALDYVFHQTYLRMLEPGYVRYNAESSGIEINLGDLDIPMFAQSEYYWEEETLFRKGR